MTRRPRAWLHLHVGCLGCALPLLAVIIVLAVVFVRVHGWNDVSVGTNTSYCGMHWQADQWPFYCQSGH